MLLTGLGTTSLMIYNKSFSVTKTSAFHFPQMLCWNCTILHVDLLCSILVDVAASSHCPVPHSMVVVVL